MSIFLHFFILTSFYTYQPNINNLIINGQIAYSTTIRKNNQELNSEETKPNSVPLDLNQFIAQLKFYVANEKTSSEVISVVSTQGINFVVTTEVLRQIIEIGADEDIVEALLKADQLRAERIRQAEIEKHDLISAMINNPGDDYSESELKLLFQELDPLNSIRFRVTRTLAQLPNIIVKEKVSRFENNLPVKKYPTLLISLTFDSKDRKENIRFLNIKNSREITGLRTEGDFSTMLISPFIKGNDVKFEPATLDSIENKIYKNKKNIKIYDFSIPQNQSNLTLTVDTDSNHTDLTSIPFRDKIAFSGRLWIDETTWCVLRIEQSGKILINKAKNKIVTAILKEWIEYDWTTVGEIKCWLPKKSKTTLIYDNIEFSNTTDYTEYQLFTSDIQIED